MTSSRLACGLVVTSKLGFMGVTLIPRDLAHLYENLLPEAALDYQEKPTAECKRGGGHGCRHAGWASLADSEPVTTMRD